MIDDGKRTVWLCQEDAYLRSVEAEVLSCEREGDGYSVVLDRTVLFPEGGGQPSDRGTVDGHPVVELRRGDEGAVVHLLDEPVSGKVTVELDWERRFDHMQQHTAQHLLTALTLDRFGHKTIGFHLGPERCDIDLDCRDLPEERLRAMEEMVNDHVRQNRPIGQRWVQAGEMEGLGVRTRGLPEGFSGPVRLIEIEGVDLNTCGGTHVRTTGELQAVKLLGTERLSRGTRVYYLAGGRVLDALDRALVQERELNRVFSCGPERHVQVAEQALEEAQNGRKELSRMRLKLAGYIGRELAASEGAGFFHDPDGDMPFLQAVAAAAKEQDADRWLLLTGGEREGVFLVSGPADRVREVGTKVAEILEGRGGGPPGMFQGKATRLDLSKEAEAAVLRATEE